MRPSPSQLLLLTAVVGTGVLLIWSQAEAVVSWRPTVTLHLSMGLVAAGAFLSVIPTLSRKRGSKE